MVDAYGTITWWGFSPSLDLQEQGKINKKKGLLKRGFADVMPVFYANNARMICKNL